MARSVDWPALERASPLLAVLPPSARRAARAVHLPKSARLFSRGDRPGAMYFVVSGEVHLVRLSPTGSEIVLQRARQGFLAEASLDQAAYHCDAVTVLPSELLMLPRKTFLEALAADGFRSRWIAHLARELRRVRAQAERLSLRTAQERIVHYLETEGNDGSIRLNQSKKDWAAELGLTHEALYRTLARMERCGRIHIDGASLSIRS
ncbi:MAG: Crp/Fnr family transcriptional regulator [Xanthobacteraceae bacterium]